MKSRELGPRQFGPWIGSLAGKGEAAPSTPRGSAGSLSRLSYVLVLFGEGHHVRALIIFPGIWEEHGEDVAQMRRQPTQGSQASGGGSKIPAEQSSCALRSPRLLPVINRRFELPQPLKGMAPSRLPEASGTPQVRKTQETGCPSPPLRDRGGRRAPRSEVTGAPPSTPPRQQPHLWTVAQCGATGCRTDQPSVATPGPKQKPSRLLGRPGPDPATAAPPSWYP